METPKRLKCGQPGPIDSANKGWNLSRISPELPQDTGLAGTSVWSHLKSVMQTQNSPWISRCTVCLYNSDIWRPASPSALRTIIIRSQCVTITTYQWRLALSFRSVLFILLASQSWRRSWHVPILMILRARAIVHNTKSIVWSEVAYVWPFCPKMTHKTLLDEHKHTDTHTYAPPHAHRQSHTLQKHTKRKHPSTLLHESWILHEPSDVGRKEDFAERT